MCYSFLLLLLSLLLVVFLVVVAVSGLKRQSPSTNTNHSPPINEATGCASPSVGLNIGLSAYPSNREEIQKKPTLVAVVAMILATKIVTNLYCFLLFSLLLQQFLVLGLPKGFQGISDTFLSVAFNFSHGISSAIVFRSGYMKVCDIRTPNFEILEVNSEGFRNILHCS